MNNESQHSNSFNYVINDVNKELDEIYSLLAYSIVFLDWQDNDLIGRGYNVGSVLVGPEKYPVAYGLNSINKFKNSTYHGEILLMTSFLSETDNFNLSGFTIYSTLEPCAMCAGMMIMTSVERSVNGQNDKYYSKALERFSINSQECGGFPPYPRTVISELNPTMYPNKLSVAYEQYINVGNKAIITKFLSTDKAKGIYKQAYHDFLSFKVNYEENQKYLNSAYQFLNQVKIDLSNK